MEVSTMPESIADLQERVAVAERERRRQKLLAARAYVTSRFYPPLPVTYGDLAVEAVEACQAGDVDRFVELSPDLNPLPRGYEDRNGVLGIRACRLVHALRLEGEVWD
jgi:hypothetical protein